MAIRRWAVYLITRLQDFAFSIVDVIIIAQLHGPSGSRELGRLLLMWRIGWRWCLAGILRFGLYGLATALSGNRNSFTFTTATISKVLFSAKADILVCISLRVGYRLRVANYVHARARPPAAT